MKKMMVVMVGLLLVSCKGKDGAPGAAGAPGASFSSSMVNRNGSVASDSILVNIPGLSIQRGDLLAVYTCIASACVQLNLYQPGVPNNMYYIVQGSNVTIQQALTGNQTLWYISAVEKI